MAFLFVYGTLKRGFRNDHLLRAARYISPARTRDAAYKMVGVCDSAYDFPGIEEGSSYVQGEVYEVSSDLLAEVDIFEGVGADYVRRLVALDNGSKAFCYFLTPHGGIAIKADHACAVFDARTNCFCWRQG